MDVFQWDVLSQMGRLQGLLSSLSSSWIFAVEGVVLVLLLLGLLVGLITEMTFAQIDLTLKSYSDDLDDLDD
jgi:hypothetical protein